MHKFRHYFCRLSRNQPTTEKLLRIVTFFGNMKSGSAILPDDITITAIIRLYNPWPTFAALHQPVLEPRLPDSLRFRPCCVSTAVSSTLIIRLGFSSTPGCFLEIFSISLKNSSTWTYDLKSSLVYYLISIYLKEISVYLDRCHLYASSLGKPFF